MKRWMKVTIVTLMVAVPAFVLGPVLFPPADVGSEPSAAQIPFFMFLGAADAILLGLGVSFLVFGLPVLRKVSPDSRLRAWAMYLAIGYLMVSWWPYLGVAVPGHGRFQRPRPAGVALHRLHLPPALGDRRRRLGLLRLRVL